MMKLKSDLYTANGTRELIVTDQIYNSIQFDEEKPTVQDPPPARRKSAKKNEKEPKERKQRRRKRSGTAAGKRTDKNRSVERNKGKEAGEAGVKRKTKSDSSVITELTSVKSSRTSSRYSCL